MTAVIFGLLSALSLGGADTLGALGSRRSGVSVTAAISSAVAAVLCGAWWALAGSAGGFSWPALWLAVGASIAVAVGTATLFAGLAVGPVGVVSAVSSTYPVLSALIGLIGYGTVLSTSDIVAILVVCGGVLLFVLVRDGGPGDVRRVLVLGGITSLAWGVGYPLLAESIVVLGWPFVTFAEFVVLTLFFTPIAVVRRDGLASVWPIAGAGAAQATGSVR